MSGPGRPSRTELLVLALILGVAAFLRFWKLGEIPFGMHPDEGHNALDALRIADGWRPAFLPGNNGREALFMYLMSVSVAVGGPTVAAVRATAAVCGVVLVAAQWLMVRSLGFTRAPRVALVSAALVAIGFWPVAQSRYGLRASLLPVWVALLVWAWWKVVSGPRIRLAPAAGAGAFVGLAALTHLTGRILLIIPAVSALAELAARRGIRAASAWVLAAVVALVVAVPEIVYLARQPEMATYRSDQVSITNPEVNEGNLAGALLLNARRLIETPVLKGDGSWYHNIRHRPVFDLAVALAFLGGLVLLAADAIGRGGGLGRRRALVLVTTLGVTVLPSALSEGAPNYVRMTGVIPVLFLLPARALDAGAAWLDRWLERGLAWQEPAAPGEQSGTSGSRRRTKSATGTIMLVGVLAVSAAWTVSDYFFAYARAPETYDAFNGAAVERARQLSGLDGSVYASPALWNQSVIRFLNHERPPTSFDPRAGLVLPASGDASYAFDPVEKDAVDAFVVAWPDAQLAEFSDSRGLPSLYVFHLNRADWPGDAGRAGDPLGVFGQAIALNSIECAYVADATGVSGQLAVTLEWTAVSPTPTDHNFFVHVTDGNGEALAQWDGPPLDGSYGTDEWSKGERVLQTVKIPLERGQPDSCEVAHGWYDWRDGVRLQVPGTADNAVQFSSPLE